MARLVEEALAGLKAVALFLASLFSRPFRRPARPKKPMRLMRDEVERLLDIRRRRPPAAFQLIQCHLRRLETLSVEHGIRLYEVGFNVKSYVESLERTLQEQAYLNGLLPVPLGMRAWDLVRKKDLSDPNSTNANAYRFTTDMGVRGSPSLEIDKDPALVQPLSLDEFTDIWGYERGDRVSRPPPAPVYDMAVELDKPTIPLDERRHGPPSIMAPPLAVVIQLGPTSGRTIEIADAIEESLYSLVPEGAGGGIGMIEAQKLPPSPSADNETPIPDNDARKGEVIPLAQIRLRKARRHAS